MARDIHCDLLYLSGNELIKLNDVRKKGFSVANVNLKNVIEMSNPTNSICVLFF